MGAITVSIAKALMRLREQEPPEPTVAVGKLGEVFHHPLFVDGTAEVRDRIMRASAESRYQDEQTYPWDNYFGRSVKPWVKGDTLDLGCFTGGRAIAWTERYETTSIAGVDISDVMVEAARQFATARAVTADFRIGSGEAIPWPDDSFDTVLSFDVLEHVRNVAATLRDCRRVLRPGGHLLVVFPSYFQPIEHHLTLATGSPCLQWVFDGGTLIEAYRQILADRPDAAWYARTHGLEEWERGNTINGTTGRQFAQLIRDQGWGVQLHPRLPIGAVGRRTSSGKGRVLARVCGPLTRAPGLREAVTHRITYILRRPD